MQWTMPPPSSIRLLERAMCMSSFFCCGKQSGPLEFLVVLSISNFYSDEKLPERRKTTGINGKYYVFLVPR